ncbi:hypothetical protein ATANTOWER_007743 [Ataeniobius toweri]|uniref:Uncharacterized protein n=1 Tax=Ataeniobius toweri TaxID=208326 RepID=A0ABU7BHP6_9TELE|nr:hypothetical protein [Ataeniobius toweri]
MHKTKNEAVKRVFLPQNEWFCPCCRIYHWLLVHDLRMVLGAPLGYAADWTGPEQIQCKSRVTVNTALSETTRGEMSSMEQQQQTQGMIQDLKTLPGVSFL